jgi:hypothetical protein
METGAGVRYLHFNDRPGRRVTADGGMRERRLAASIPVFSASRAAEGTTADAVKCRMPVMDAVTRRVLSR